MRFMGQHRSREIKIQIRGLKILICKQGRYLKDKCLLSERSVEYKTTPEVKSMQENTSMWFISLCNFRAYN